MEPIDDICAFAAQYGINLWMEDRGNWCASFEDHEDHWGMDPFAATLKCMAEQRSMLVDALANLVEAHLTGLDVDYRQLMAKHVLQKIKAIKP
jgi:hypothetical protein